MKRKYRVTLPVTFEADGEHAAPHHAGAVVELTDDAAKLYAHALIAIEEKETEDAGHSN